MKVIATANTIAARIRFLLLEDPIWCCPSEIGSFSRRHDPLPGARSGLRQAPATERKRDQHKHRDQIGEPSDHLDPDRVRLNSKDAGDERFDRRAGSYEPGEVDRRALAERQP